MWLMLISHNFHLNKTHEMCFSPRRIVGADVFGIAAWCSVDHLEVHHCRGAAERLSTAPSTHSSVSLRLYDSYIASEHGHGNSDICIYLPVKMMMFHSYL